MEDTNNTNIPLVDAPAKAKRQHLVLVNPPMPTEQEVKNVLANAKTAPLADILGPSFGARLIGDQEFAKLHAAVSNATSVTGFMGGDDYLALEELKVMATELGLEASQFETKAWKQALLTLRNRFHCSRSKRKEVAVEAAKALVYAPQAAE